MGPKTKELIDVLEQLISLLESDNEKHWAGRLKQARSRILNADYSGIESLLSAYGGMGSFNDLVICQTVKNGKVEFMEGYAEKNETLSELRAKARELAVYIKHDQA